MLQQDMPYDDLSAEPLQPSDYGGAFVPFPEDPALRAELDDFVLQKSEGTETCRHEDREAEEQEPDTPESLLKRIWGYEGFRGIQREIIGSILEGHDTLGLMPTGGGKSIAFQVPALLLKGLCLVITPLISLMRDQVTQLRRKGIKATCIHTGMPRTDILREFDNCILGGYSFLYLSPERLQSPLFIEKLPRMRVSMITVDEAHCISQWGYDFRPSYLEIAALRKLLPGVPVLALTATATPRVADDIMEKLAFKADGRMFRMSFIRKNLAYKVETLPQQTHESKTDVLLRHLNTTEGSCIVYTRNRRHTEELASTLVSQGITALAYHAGLVAADRNERQQMWIDGRVRVMVATNAFGMGIDKPDVRHVYHMDVPDAIEEYFQEAGRAGRDGQPSEALLLINERDIPEMLKHCEEEFPWKRAIAEVYEDLGSFFQLAVGDGENVSYDFEPFKFCRYFKYSLKLVEASLHILQYSGYLEYTDGDDCRSRVLFIVTREALYHERHLSLLDEGVMLALLRKYTGLFADYVTIDEKMLAETCRCTEHDVYEALLSLTRQRIVHYIPRKNTPTITFTRRRVDRKYLHIPPEAYELRMERRKECLGNMIAYFKNDEECRSRQLVRYFGEPAPTADCGICDVCLRHGHAKTVQKADRAEERERKVLDILSDGGRHDITEFYALPYLREEIADCLLALIEQHRIALHGGHIILTPRDNGTTL